jgi:hypothetical protein
MADEFGCRLAVNTLKTDYQQNGDAQAWFVFAQQF